MIEWVLPIEVVNPIGSLPHVAHPAPPVPAYYSVEMLGAAAGVLGDTDAYDPKGPQPLNLTTATTWDSPTLPAPAGLGATVIAYDVGDAFKMYIPRSQTPVWERGIYR